MFREMRVKKRLMSEEDAEELLKSASHGVLAVAGDEGYPYAVPVSFVYKDRKIYIHSALEGHKVDAVKQNSKVSFCVVTVDNVVPEKLTTRYASAVAFGTAKILTSKGETEPYARLLAEKYGCHDEMIIQNELNRYAGKYCILEIVVDHLTGKSSISPKAAK